MNTLTTRELINLIMMDDLQGGAFASREKLLELDLRELRAVYKAVEEARDTIARAIADRITL